MVGIFIYDHHVELLVRFFCNNYGPDKTWLHVVLFKETNGESGNPIWKNRVESWKEKKKEKKSSKKEGKTQIPVEQHMEENE